MTTCQANRGGMRLTVNGCGVAVYPPGATFGPRRLEDFEFVWLLQGTAEWRHELGGIALGSSSLLLGRPGITDSFIWDRTRPTRHGYLHFEVAGQLAQLPYHFSRRFHRRYGQPPGRYRHASPRLQPAQPLAQAGLLVLSDHIWRAT
jgi:hypothetical protein